MNAFVSKVHSLNPLAAALRRNAGEGLNFLRNFSSSIRLFSKVRAAIISGKEKHSGQSLSALYIGHLANFHFIMSKVYSDFNVTEEYAGIHFLTIMQWVEAYEKKVDLIFVDLEIVFSIMLRPDHFVVMPSWVRQRLHIPEDMEGVLAGMHRKTKKELRRILKQGFTYGISRSVEDLRHFYHEMYVPHIISRYGDQAIVVSEQELFRRSHGCELIQLFHNGRLIQGVVVHKGRCLTIGWIGVSRGVEPDAMRGASDALDFFAVSYGLKSGCAAIDFGTTRPLLNDGVFRYKRKWGTHVRKCRVPKGNIFVRPSRFVPSTIGFFTNNPLVVRDGNKLAGRILFSGERLTGRHLQQMKEQCMTDGLECLKIFSLSGLEVSAMGFLKGNSVGLKVFDLSHSRDPERDFCGM